MLFKTLFASSLATSAIAGYNPATPEQRSSVADWDAVMKKVAEGYDYEVHETLTEDDWVLTLFRIIPREDRAKERNGRTVLF